MANNVKKGTYPIFGYPLFAFSPTDGEGKGPSVSEASAFNWNLMYTSTMNAKKGKEG
jgi:hypothetical protein